MSKAEELTVLGAAVKAFAKVDSVQTIAITIPKGDEDAARAAIPSQFFNTDKPKIIFTEGGKTRQASVYNALFALKQFYPCYVLIHDGARPWVTPALINSVIDAAQKHGAAIPLLAFTETPKETGSGENGTFVTRHLKRADTGGAQTPQGFKFQEILHAHEKASMEQNEEYTDDAEVWGKFCGDVAVVPGDPENKKITFIEDL